MSQVRELRAFSIARPVLEIARRGPSAVRVLAAFPRAANLVTPGGDVLSIVTPDVGNGPLNVVVDAGPGGLPVLPPGAPANLAECELVAGPLRVVLQHAAVWEPRPDWPALRAALPAVRAELPAARALALASAPAGSLLALLFPSLENSSTTKDTKGTKVFGPCFHASWCPGGHGDSSTKPDGPPLGETCQASDPATAARPSPLLPPSNRPDRSHDAGTCQDSASALLRAATRGAHALRAAWSGDAPALTAAAALAGLGPGLTPAGDDFLAGALVWAWLAHPEPAAFCGPLAAAAAPRTTTLAAALLRAAARGECSATWHALLAALAGGAGPTLGPAIRAVLAHGATSGADMLAGLLWLAG